MTDTWIIKYCIISLDIKNEHSLKTDIIPHPPLHLYPAHLFELLIHYRKLVFTQTSNQLTQTHNNQDISSVSTGDFIRIEFRITDSHELTTTSLLARTS